jgi:dienelactone hydrolase
MAEILLFHHAQGLTDGVQAVADDLRAAGHVVHVPDLFEGRTFGDVNEGVAHAKEVGFDTIDERGRAAADGLPNEIVYAGFSLGAMQAQGLAQTRPGAKGALLISSAVPPSEFGGDWPQGVPLQIHMMEDDEWVQGEGGDLDAARQIAESTDDAELFLYPGDRHLFADKSVSDYDDGAATLLRQRVVDFLGKID